MQVTAANQTAEGQRYELNNGDALLMKQSVTCGGKPCVYPVYVFANGLRTSARSGRWASSTLVPAMAAVRRYQA